MGPLAQCKRWLDFFPPYLKKKKKEIRTFQTVQNLVFLLHELSAAS